MRSGPHEEAGRVGGEGQAHLYGPLPPRILEGEPSSSLQEGRAHARLESPSPQGQGDEDSLQEHEGLQEVHGLPSHPRRPSPQSEVRLHRGEKEESKLSSVQVDSGLALLVIATGVPIVVSIVTFGLHLNNRIVALEAKINTLMEVFEFSREKKEE